MTFLDQRATAVELQAATLPSSVGYLLVTPTSAIDQTMPFAAVEASFVLLLRSQPDSMNHNA